MTFKSNILYKKDGIMSAKPKIKWFLKISASGEDIHRSFIVNSYNRNIVLYESLSKESLEGSRSSYAPVTLNLTYESPKEQLQYVLEYLKNDLKDFDVSVVLELSYKEDFETLSDIFKNEEDAEIIFKNFSENLNS